MTQNQQIAKHLKAGKSLTALQALNRFGCFRLASRVRELKDQGMRIDSEKIKVNGKYITKYSA
jgi:hypothetical protein